MDNSSGTSSSRKFCSMSVIQSHTSTTTFDNGTSVVVPSLGATVTSFMTTTYTSATEVTALNNTPYTSTTGGLITTCHSTTTPYTSTTGGLITTSHSTTTPYTSTTGGLITTCHSTTTPYASNTEITTSHMTTAPCTCTAGITASSITRCTVSVATSHAVTAASSTEQETLYTTLNQAKVKPAILKLVSPYSKSFIPMQTLPTFPS